MLRFFAGSAQQQVERLASADRLTVFVGAGASMEVGLPSWEGLVHELVEELITERGWDDHRSELRERAGKRGLLYAAEVVEAVAGGDLSHRIKRQLYREFSPKQVQPGPLAAAVAALRCAVGPDMRIGTTNYDVLIEEALRRHPGASWRTVRSYVTGRRPPDDCAGVTHLHGLLADQDKGKVVLTEGDFARMRSHTWQEEWMVDALENSVCLFLGASLTDANLVRYLHRAGRGDDHVVLWRSAPEGDPRRAAARDLWQEAETPRWRRLGVTPLYADNYADIAQFVHEIALCRRQGAAYVSPVRRMNDWFDTATEAGVLTAEEGSYRQVQELLHDSLRDVLAVARGSVAGLGDVSETMACALWSLYPPAGVHEPVPSRLAGQERTVILATSDRVMTTPDTLEPVPVDPLSRWAGVQAICDGSSLGVEVDSYTSRWRYVYAVPVFRPDPRLPLGALTISTTCPGTTTVLQGMPSGARHELDGWLSEVAFEILTLGEISG